MTLTEGSSFLSKYLVCLYRDLRLAFDFLINSSVFGHLRVFGPIQPKNWTHTGERMTMTLNIYRFFATEPLWATKNWCCSARPPPPVVISEGGDDGVVLMTCRPVKMDHIHCTPLQYQLALLLLLGPDKDQTFKMVAQILVWFSVLEQSEAVVTDPVCVHVCVVCVRAQLCGCRHCKLIKTVFYRFEPGSVKCHEVL